MNWYYAKNGAQEGPISTEGLRAKIDSGEVAATDLAWREGLPDWLPVSEVPDFTRQNAAPSAAAPVDLEPSSPYASPQAPAPAAYSPVSSAYSPVAQSPVPAPVLSSGLAIASMVCGILGFLGCWVPFFSVLIALLTVILGHIALAKAFKNPARFGGKGMARTGLVLGYIALLLGAIVTVGYIRFVAKITKMTPEEQKEYIESYKWMPVSPEMQQSMHDQQKAQEEARLKRQQSTTP